MSIAEQTAETAGQELAMTEQERYEAAEKLVKNRVYAAVGAGLVPVPLLDVLALGGIQIEMVRALSALYGVPFSENLGKSVISSFVGGVLPVGIAPMVASIIKIVPLVGHTAGVLTMSIVGGASTYALGKVFIKHFETGGTLLNLDTLQMKSYFDEKYKEGLKVAKSAESAAAK